MTTRLDPITLLMGYLPADERDVRSDLRNCHILASHRLHHAKGPTERALWWDAARWASEHVFAPASVEELQQIKEACRRLISAARQFEKIEAPDGLV